MSAAIRALVIQRPRYNNAHIADSAAWYADNALELKRYYRACDEALREAGGPVNPREEIGEYDYFRRIQYERAAAQSLMARRDL